MRSGRVPGRCASRKKLPPYPVTAWRFREARLTLGLSVLACADLLHVSERTIRGWESGSTRIPYSAYKLMRVLRGGRYLAHPMWQDFTVRGSTLITPEGRHLAAHELGWWSLLVLQAQQWRNVSAEQSGRPASDVSASMLRHCNAPDLLTMSGGQPGPDPVAHVDKVSTLGGTFPRSPGHKVIRNPPARRVGPKSNTGQNTPKTAPRSRISARGGPL